MERTVHTSTAVARIEGDRDNDINETIGATHSLRDGAATWHSHHKVEGSISGRRAAGDLRAIIT
jgi:hypothetical protein